MSIRQGVDNFEAPPIDLHGLVRELFPINRSLTGAGVRETLAILARFIQTGDHRSSQRHCRA